MNGKDRWMDNVYIERLWKSFEYEDIYLNGTVSPVISVRKASRSGETGAVHRFLRMGDT
jgi:hypothetical protein